MTTDLDRLDALAAAATPGPWRASAVTRHGTRGIYPEGFGPPPIFVTNSLSDEDAAFIAACDPATIRSLVAELRWLREALQIIANGSPDWTPQSISVKARNIARAALHREDGT